MISTVDLPTTEIIEPAILLSRKMFNLVMLDWNRENSIAIAYYDKLIRDIMLFFIKMD